jgi:hypothetical protein
MILTGYGVCRLPRKYRKKLIICANPSASHSSATTGVTTGKGDHRDRRVRETQSAVLTNQGKVILRVVRSSLPKVELSDDRSNRVKALLMPNHFGHEIATMRNAARTNGLRAVLSDDRSNRVKVSVGRSSVPRVVLSAGHFVPGKVGTQNGGHSSEATELERAGHTGRV